MAEVLIGLVLVGWLMQGKGSVLSGSWCLVRGEMGL